MGSDTIRMEFIRAKTVGVDPAANVFEVLLIIGNSEYLNLSEIEF